VPDSWGMTHNTQWAIAKAVLETLEGRQYMSAATIGLNNGVLSMQADPNTASTLKVVLSADKSSVTATTGDQNQTFKFSQLKSLVLTGSTGDDYIYVDPGLNLPAQIKANGGNDTIWGGSGLDNIDGGNGNVQIHAHGVITTGSGDDSVWGSNQGDTITAGSGTDLIVCGNGNNVVYGGSGHDTLIGGAGNDHIVAGSGTTVIYGGMGDDTLIGGIGHDTIYGGGGNDMIAVNSTTTVLHADSTDVAVAGTMYHRKSSPTKTTPAPTPVKAPAPAPVTSASPVPTPAPAAPTTNSGGLKPVITQLETTVIAGEGVNVNALTSVIPTGTVLTTTYKWDFGDPGSKYNVLPGWNAGHVYDKAGTYTITLTMTDSAGHVATKTSQVTVAADTRPVIYVDTNGSDSNSGASPSQAVKSIGEAFALAGSNTKIELKRGETFPVTSTLWLKGNDQAVEAYGTGASPVLMFAPLDASEVTIFVGSQATNITIQDLTFDSPNAVTSGPADTINDFAIWAGGTDLVVRGNTFNNVEDAVNGTQQPTGVIVQENSAPLLKGMRGYLCWVDGNNWSIIGNTVVNTTRAHCVRVNDSDVVGVLIADNNLTKQYPADDPGEAQKTTVNVRIGNYVYIANNVLNGSTVSISNSPGQTIDQTVNWVVLDGNTINNAQLTVNEVAHHVMIRNNVLNITGTGQIAITPTSADIPGAVLTDLTISHNTGINTGQDGEFINVFSQPAPGSIAIDHNVYSAAGIRFGYGWDSAVWINAPDLTGFASITDNIWPTSNNLKTPGVVNYFAGAATATGYLTEQGWNSLPGVSNDQYSNEALPSGSYQLTLNGVTAGALTVAKAA
jgi:hypothetical protein